MIVNNPCNQTQNDWDNVHGKENTDLLNERFLNGQIIDLHPFDGMSNVSCHVETKLIFKNT
jgi:hypothetical protein